MPEQLALDFTAPAEAPAALALHPVFQRIAAGSFTPEARVNLDPWHLRARLESWHFSRGRAALDLLSAYWANGKYHAAYHGERRLVQEYEALYPLLDRLIDEELWRWRTPRMRGVRPGLRWPDYRRKR